MEIGLLEGEQVVLDDGYVGYRRKLALTNKRLVYVKGEGFLKLLGNWIKKFPWNRLKKHTLAPRGLLTQMSVAMLKMKILKQA